MADKTKYYPFLPKGSALESFKTVSSDQYAYTQYGEEITGSYPYKSNISIDYFYANSGFISEKRKIYALKNTLNSYLHLSPHYAYDSILGNKGEQALKLISIPSIYYGSSIDKGSVELSYYTSGYLVGKLQDVNKNGDLIVTVGNNSGSVAGVVLYNEGFIILTGSWIVDYATDVNIYNPAPATDYARWIHWGAGLNEDPSLTTNSSFDLAFEGVNYINTITMLAHAEKGELDRKSTRLNSSHVSESRMPSSA